MRVFPCRKQDSRDGYNQEHAGELANGNDIRLMAQAHPSRFHAQPQHKANVKSRSLDIVKNVPMMPDNHYEYGFKQRNIHEYPSAHCVPSRRFVKYRADRLLCR
jgi:hypothetical protein